MYFDEDGPFAIAAARVIDERPVKIVEGRLTFLSGTENYALITG
jgi:hypothetical protein